jgi:hypothetical protein
VSADVPGVEPPLAGAVVQLGYVSSPPGEQDAVVAGLSVGMPCIDSGIQGLVTGGAGDDAVTAAVPVDGGGDVAGA